MTWFKLDDGFHCHPKVLEAGNEVIGLYVRCGSWASQQLTDGFVPTSIALLYGSCELTEVLVAVNLWTRVSGGWQMHDYLTYNPSKQQVQADRHAAAERQKRARERAREAREARESARDSHAVTHTNGHASSHASSHAVTTPVSHADVTPAVTVPPTRPDPTRNYTPTPVGSTSGFDDFLITADAATVRAESDFETFWRQWPRKDAKKAARSAYEKARRNKIPAAHLLSSAAQQIAAWRATGRPKDKIPYGASWLNGERWNDEVEKPRFTVITNEESPWSGYRIENSDSPWAADMGRSS